MADSQADTVKSPIIMKVDGPDDEKEENEENEKKMQEPDSEIKPSQVCSPFSRPAIISSPRFSFTNNPFSPKSNNIASAATTGAPSPSFRNVLRPSQLGQAVTKSFTLNPSKLNPFVDKNKPEPDNNGDKKELNGESVSLKFVPLLPNSNTETPKFVPLLDKEKSTEVKPVTKAPAQTSHSFVFGQNLQERVVTGEDEEPKPSTSLSKNTNGMQKSSGDHSSSADMLFSSAIKEVPVVSSTSESGVGAVSKSLSESAREYEEQRANKRKYEEVEVKTGEEDETNVLHVSCKLFAFDKTVGNWQERGRGNLRLNDQLVREEDGTSYVQSRIVFRTSGVLRVILNTKIWAEMTIEQASAKSVRFTAMDGGEIKVFLVMTGSDETKQLYKHLQERLTSEQKRQNLKKANTNNNKDFDKEKTSEPPETN